ncbi:MAG: hypothetical protein WCH32_17470, partial [Pseudomonadota bacterium]
MRNLSVSTPCSRARSRALPAATKCIEQHRQLTQRQIARSSRWHGRIERIERDATNVAILLVLMPPPRHALCLPCADA